MIFKTSIFDCMRLLLLVILTSTLVLSAIGQSNWSRLPLPVKKGPQILPFAMAGGVDQPQIYETDLNFDGKQDLLVFDRQGNAWIPLVAEATGNSSLSGFKYAPEYEAYLPPAKNWVVVRDFNGDGIGDLFTSSTIPGIAGIEVWRGRKVQQHIEYTRLRFAQGPHPVMYFQSLNGTFTQIYVTDQDIPAIEDVDGDGDLDVVTFNLAGGFVEYFRNRSLELGFGKDSLRFQFVTNCFGGIYEDGISGCVDLAKAPGECAKFQGGQAVNRHAGSTLLLMDYDNDGDKDLLLGDLSFANVVLLKNGGSAAQAWYNVQDCSFPSNNTPINLPNFPAMFSLDLNGDGLRDLIAAPNIRAENYNNTWYYQNTGTVANPEFVLLQKDLFTANMLDVGSASRPAIADVNGDGLLDLVIGNWGFYTNSSVPDSRLFLYLNTGTATQPVFSLTDDNWLNFKLFTGSLTDAFYSLAPAFGDLDADGDLDLVVGNYAGSLFYVRNDAGAGKPMNFGNIQPNWQSIDVGAISVPAVADMNKDGKMDLVIGELNANPIDPMNVSAGYASLNYFQNTGTTGNPAFSSNVNQMPNTGALGRIQVFDTANPSFRVSNSSPALWPSSTGHWVVVGSRDSVFVYHLTAGQLYQSSPKLAIPVPGSFSVGQYLHPALGDLNKDGILECVLGNERGGISAFSTGIKTDGTLVAAPLLQTEQAAITIVPNPGSDWCRVEGAIQGEHLSVWNLQGQLMLQEIIGAVSQVVLMSSWPEGTYLFRVTGKQGTRQALGLHVK